MTSMFTSSAMIFSCWLALIEGGSISICGHPISTVEVIVNLIITFDKFKTLFQNYIMDILYDFLLQL
jgi:hypothetical protein